MNTLFLTAISATLIGAGALSACNNASAPKTEEAAAVAYDVAKENLDKFRMCSTENVLTDISTYSNDVADPTLEQAAWFEANGKRDGVVTTASGLQYKVNQASTMKSNPPRPEQTVRVHYHGQFLNGDKFDSSYDRGEDIEFGLSQVIKGWTLGVGMMRPCDAWTLYIPSDLAYGDAGRGSIPAASPLVFHVQLLGISD